MPSDDTIQPMAGSDEWRCAAATVPPGQSATFRLEHAGRTVQGFVVNHDGHYRAYVNRCPHVGTPLDLWPNEFFTEDGRALICSTHGAVYDPIDGLCTAGPCVGDRLAALPLTLDGETLVVRWPPGDPAPGRR
jgi:nitrite reductase/ring-hydroxylating ferredoxin subunit